MFIYIYIYKKVNTLLKAKDIYKGRKEILIAFEENIFPLPKRMCLVKMNGKKKTFLVMKNLCQKLLS